LVGTAVPDCYYIHDLCVLPWAQGAGVGGALCERVLHVARTLGLESTFLVAVQGSAPFWQRSGFATIEKMSPPMSKTLGKYGADARFMQLSNSMLALT
jgi:N-acetylglutamate synthase-like GNAT family acetyltransferase